LGSDFANSSRFHSAPFHRQPVNRSTGPRFHACRAVAWRRRVRSVAPSQIVEDRLPRRHERVSFAKSHQPAGRASGPCRNLRPHSAPKISPTSGRSGQADGLTPARQPAGDGPLLTRPPRVNQLGPTPRPKPSTLPWVPTAHQRMPSLAARLPNTPHYLSIPSNSTICGHSRHQRLLRNPLYGSRSKEPPCPSTISIAGS
jgi:hypothetical protein